MSGRKASVKETGEQLSQEEWARFEKAAETAKTERPNSKTERPDGTSKKIKEKTTDASTGKT